MSTQQSTIARYTIEVTAEDIKQGWRCNACACPVALALNRKFDETFLVNQIHIQPMMGKKFTIITPQGVKEFIYRFDKGLGFLVLEPFTFVLEVPDGEKIFPNIPME